MAAGAIAANAAGGAAASQFDLTRKVGPLPLWAWLGIGFGVGYFLYKRHQSSTAAASSTAAQLAGQATSTTGPGMQYPSNTDWSTAAANGAISAGFDPSTVETALSDFLNGTPLSSQDEAVLNWILSNFGSPPGGPSPVIGGGVNGGAGPAAPPPPTTSPSQAPTPPQSVLSHFTLIAHPQDTTNLLAHGFNVFTFGDAQFYDPSQHVQAGAKGQGYQWIPTPARATELHNEGYSLISEYGAEFYNPGQRVAA